MYWTLHSASIEPLYKITSNAILFELLLNLFMEWDKTFNLYIVFILEKLDNLADVSLLPYHVLGNDSEDDMTKIVECDDIESVDIYVLPVLLKSCIVNPIEQYASIVNR